MGIGADHALAVRADADDVLQTVLLRMHRQVSSLADTERLNAWMYKIARNTIIDHYRRAGRSATTQDVEIPVEPLAGADKESTAHRALASVLAPFVDGLPEPYRQALRWVEFDGLIQTEAASRAEISVSGMKSRVQRGRLKLRATIEACCDVALDARGRVMEMSPRPDGVAPNCGCETA
ncbi:MAG: RNA polymerase sigma-70 factor (ECF subfamily) [Myxococcota bacterium]